MRSCSVTVGRCSHRAESAAAASLNLFCIGASRSPFAIAFRNSTGSAKPAQAADDKGFEIGRRDPLTSGTVRLGASDEAAGDVVAIPRSLLDRVGRIGSELASKTMPASRLGSRALSPSRRSIRFSSRWLCTRRHRSSSTIAACSTRNTLPLWTISPRVNSVLQQEVKVPRENRWPP